MEPAHVLHLDPDAFLFLLLTSTCALCSVVFSKFVLPSISFSFLFGTIATCLSTVDCFGRTVYYIAMLMYNNLGLSIGPELISRTR